MLSVNQVFCQDRESPYGHRTIFDFHLLQAVLQQGVIGHAERRAFRQGTDPRLLVDTPTRQV